MKGEPLRRSTPGVAERDGGIHMILGSMFSGKSTELLRRIKIWERKKRAIFVVKPAGDTRYEDTGETAVTTHDKHKVEAVRVEHLADVLADMLEHDVVAID